MRRPALAVNAVLAVLLLVAVVLSYRTLASAKAAADSGTRTSLVTVGPVSASVSAIGAVQSAAMANISFAAPGTVSEINVKIGDTVKKDQVLAKIDASQAQEQLRAAKANLTSAEQSLSRVRSTTTDANTITFAQAQVTTAQSSVSSAQHAVDGTVLTAPMGGTVIAVNGTVGTFWNSTFTGGGTDSQATSTSPAGAPFIQIADVTKLQISTSFPEVDAMKIRTDQVATVTWAALSRTSVTGRVTAIAPAATNQNNVNSYPVTVSLDSLPDGVRIGQTVTVAVTVAKVDGAVRVPVAAIRRSGERYTAKVLRPDGRLETRTLQLGLQGDEFVEIVSGLAVDELVTLNQGGGREN